jgi:cytochrome P450
MAFNPDRDPADLSHIPSAWRHLLTFGAGPRNCIGFRLAVTEMKAILFTLIRTYSFSIETEISRTWLIIQRPSVGGTPQMPLVVTRI